ncbi:MAG: PD40 domain-containing protein [Anaerolineaceae bacterium]|nr:PD40 domain-containing protein [Anaerolineaceae bacterium]
MRILWGALRGAIKKLTASIQTLRFGNIPQSNMVAYAVIAALLLLVLIGSLVWRNQQIVFVGGSSYQEDYGVYRLNLLWGKPLYLASAHEVHSPEWSPDGRQIAYVSSAGPHGGPPYTIGVMNAYGRYKRLLIFGDVRCYDPAWSPDGRQIAYVQAAEYEGGSPMGLFVIDSKGGEPRQIGPYAYYSYPSWSSDGNKIVFSNWHGIAVIDADGSNYQMLTENLGDSFPAWSNDGKYIAFSSFSESKDQFYDLYVMRADGSDVRRLTDTPAHESFPSWSPGDRRIIFESNFESEDVAIDHIYEIHTDGTGFRRLVEMQSQRPDWRP